MAWIDCMRWRRFASIIRGIGWTFSGLTFCSAAVATFGSESGEGLATFAVLTGIAVLVLGIAYAIAWLADRRGDRMVTR